MEGIIKWYDSEKGFGFISTEDKDVFLHRSGLTFSADRAAEGKTVSFEINESDRGPVAVDVALVD